MPKDIEVSAATFGNDEEGVDTIFVKEKPKKTWRSNIWDTWDKTPEERRFLFKLDAGILSICCLGYFIKYLDQANLTNAYVSGMQDDLGMYDNQLNYVTTLWTVGYIIGQIPSNIVLTRVRPSIWLPSSELYVLRFFIGLAESTYYPGVLYMMGAWYRKDELGKRAVIFNVSSALATMFSGYLMTAVIGLDGRGGLKGWQWLYIMDGVISLPLALAGFFVMPDTPANSRDKAIAIARVQKEKREQLQPYTRQKMFKILASWHIYLLPLLFFLAGAAGALGQPIFSLYLKDSVNPKYTTAQINDYPTVTSAVQIVACLVYAWVSDGLLDGRRWPVLLFATTISFVLYVSLAVWDIPEGWRWACYIIAGQGVIVSPLILVWATEICSDDAEERAIVVGTTNDFGYVISAWLPLIIWQTVDAPRYHKGFITASCSCVAAVVLIMVINILVRRDQISLIALAAEQLEYTQ
ncbi:hypothetical protein UA08_03111 [Talaromyces atroroseus]|uniref:Major facilitator superfamily (MFS) profile domain-containing protein n=1 Tax=Talaromyces atroroseus TaxID=1441469 RepID=A0A225B194_TALAT|nr:hypothetical protein UA08_03111 [Talaromyces atroroseus]OKL61016.1 hypothetical protein UA08_03111 [Talaromyces atroroseus]